MEWNLVTVDEDLDVPNNGISESFSSHDIWSSWDRIVGSFNSPKKLTMLGVDDCTLTEPMFSSDVEQYSFPSASCQQSSCPHEHSDVQLDDDLLILDDTDDNSLPRLMFDEDGSIQNCISGFENASQSLPAKELKFGIYISEEHFNLPEDKSEEDMSVLLDLQRLTVQLAKKTRICFRDSFYRLAENSRHDSDRTQNSKETTEKCGPATVNNGSLRSPESKAKNSNTNAIDRTVATLMFNTVKCCNVDATRIPDLIAASEHHGNFNVYSV